MILKKIIDALSIREKKKSIYIKVYKTYILSKFIKQFLDILIIEGYIYTYYLSNDNNNYNIMITPKYDLNGNSSIKSIFRIQSTNNIINLKHKDLLKLKKNIYSTFILTTSKGIMTLDNAIKNNIGGFIICKIN